MLISGLLISFCLYQVQSQATCKNPYVEQRLLSDDVPSSPFYVIALPKTRQTMELDNVCYTYFKNEEGSLFYITSLVFKNGSNTYYRFSKGDIITRMGISEATSEECVYHDYTLKPICNFAVFTWYRCYIEGQCSQTDIGRIPRVDVRVTLAANPNISRACRAVIKSNLRDTSVLDGDDYIFLPRKLSPSCITNYNNLVSISSTRARGPNTVSHSGSDGGSHTTPTPETKPREEPPHPHEVSSQPREVPSQPHEVSSQPREVPPLSHEVPPQPHEAPSHPCEVPPQSHETPSQPHEVPTQPPPSRCFTSKTTTNLRQTVCRGSVVLNEHFCTMDRWTHQVTIGGSRPEDEFVVFRKEPYASWVDKGKLFIKPSLLEDQSNDTFVKTGELNMVSSCTSIYLNECVKQANHYLILPPIISARVSTKNTFSFRYGIVEIRAKLPRGNWIVPELWLEPVNGPSTERVVMGLSRGNMDDSEFGWRTLEAGIMEETQSSWGKIIKDTPWSWDFHTFKLLWTPDQMKFTVDGQDIHQVSSKNHSVLNKQVYITLGVHVAGRTDFPDVTGKPWKNSDPKRFHKFWLAKTSWYPSWSADSVLQVESIKITAL